MKEIINSLVIILLCLMVGHCSSKVACNHKSISFEDHRYGVFSGCMVKHKGKWLPLDNIRGFDGD